MTGQLAPKKEKKKAISTFDDAYLKPGIISQPKILRLCIYFKIFLV